ncbi:replication endonuclease [Vibrio fluvialis]|uniref:replication endonuclease n=1 Tax=Vibrio fluvialis TaxID=676 RepID=UPI00112457F8|nr:replication endonuclease [Vibrio fluvialis]TOY94188.1 replication endonuclease [Vibrio fluvialis]TRN13288.1 replication protein [Vibrio fluvialis]
MENLKVPAEIDLYEFPWQAPLTEVEAGCFGDRRFNEVIQPESLSVLERKLFEANPDDFAWAQSRIQDLPDYLTKYFVTRYISVFEKLGRKEANIYLRERMAPATERAQKVLEKYSKLPTTQKVAMFSKEFESGDNAFASVYFTEHSLPEDYQRPQLSFDFDQAEKHTKPENNRSVAELEPDELRDMAFKLSQIASARHQRFAASAIKEVKADLAKREVKASESKIGEIAVVNTYHKLAAFVNEFGIKAPRKRKKQTELTALNDISRMRDEKWWRGRLVHIRKIMREHLAIAMGQVSYKASPYASWDCVREHQEQQKANYEYIKQCQLIDEITGEEADLWDMAKKSLSNPAIRRHELMVRCRGCEDIGNELELQGLFLTLTSPSKYHNSYKKGGFIDHWNGASPRDTQAYLNNVWQRIRAKLGREEIRWFGVRVAEPHHDGTPHWHLLIWVTPEDVAQVRDVFISYAVEEDKEELYPQFDRNPKRAEKKQALHGPFNYKPRCDFGYIDPAKGTATGYIAKYISKNIDGFAMDDEISDETGKPVKDMAKNVNAWKSRWGIRQFQFFGGAPVTTYRELRRFANNDKASFNQYLTQLNYEELLTIYEELDVREGLKLIGPPIPAELIRRHKKFDSKYLFVLLTQVYQADLEHENGTVTEVMKAADRGQWRDYIMGQGGPFVKRADLLITNVYEELPFASPHGETVRKLDGFDASGVFIKTRLRVWTIKQKSKVNDDVEAIAQGSAATVIGGPAASRSSVNNCTEPREDQVSDQLTRLLAPERRKANKPPNIDEAALAALRKGSSIRIDDERSIQIRPAEVDEYGEKRPAQLVEVSRVPADDLSWMNFEGWDEVLAQPETEEYQQPDLSFFPELEDDWPLA